MNPDVWVFIRRLLTTGAQPALHFGGRQFHEVSFDDVIVLMKPLYNCFANGHIMYFCPQTRNP